jgi:hypothetical protein
VTPRRKFVVHRRLLGIPIHSLLNIKINLFLDIICQRGTLFVCTIFSYQAPFRRNRTGQDERDRQIEKGMDGHSGLNI